MVTPARLGRTSAALAMAAALVVGAGILGARTGLWDAARGVSVASIGVGLAAVAIVLALVAAGIAIRTRRAGIVPALLALLIAGLLVGAALMRRAEDARWPPIHDVTTDITDPLRFTTLGVTANTLQAIPDAGRADLAGLTSDIKWRTWHVERYADIRPIAVPTTVPATMARVRRLAQARGWRIAAYDPAGRLEATDTSGLFGFRDDIVVAARAATDTSGSVVSMRSVGRGEGGDGGRNATRIRDFLSELKKSR